MGDRAEEKRIMVIDTTVTARVGRGVSDNVTISLDQVKVAIGKIIDRASKIELIVCLN